MNIVPINKISPFKHYFSFLHSVHLFPPEVKIIENYLFHITQDDSMLIYVLKGSAVMTLKNKKTELTPGTLVFVPPYMIVNYSESIDFEYLRLAFILKDIETKKDVCLFSEITVVSRTVSRELEYLYNSIASIEPFMNPVQEQKAVACAFNFFSVVCELTFPSAPDDASMPKINKVINFINTNPVRNDRIADLAKMAGLSEPYFRKCFKQVTGMSPTEYRNFSKIELAKSLLTHGEYMTTEYLATKIGIYDTNYFSRLFKKYTGKTPRQYQKSIFSVKTISETKN